ncbi:MAG: hypothetical protein G01um101466_485 [Parcubacteria group bacterium Gr01-1014_66]|nr:MAG: hypothetical protein G01um101466_485 [Parcubacteria group bacterium Gr01-1014_66]
MYPVIAKEKLRKEDIEELAKKMHGEMTKIAVDVRRGILAIGCMIHYQCRDALITDGSNSEDIWGANIFPGRTSEEQISYISTSVNVRPEQGNDSVEIESPQLREKIKEIVERLLF